MGRVEDIPVDEYEAKSKEIDEGFAEEEKLWADLGLDHPRQGYSPDLFLLANGLDALKGLLIEKGVIGEREVQLAIRSLMLENMKFIRTELQPQIEEMRRNAIAVRQMPPDLNNGQGRLPFEK